MAPHLMRAQGAYKGIQLHALITFQNTHTTHTHTLTFTHTHTHGTLMRARAHTHTHTHNFAQHPLQHSRYTQGPCPSLTPRSVKVDAARAP